MSLRGHGHIRLRGRSHYASPFQVGSIFTEDATQLARASTAEIEANHYAEKIANQLYYTVKAQEGKFFGYAGLGKGGSSSEWNQVTYNWKSFTPALYIVPPSQPRAKVWFVKSNSNEELRTKAENEGHFFLQSFFEAVPIPTPSLIPNGNQVQPEGTDKEVVVWCPATDEYWEMWGLRKFAAGEHAGEWCFGNGAYISRVSQSNGVLPHNWGARATGLAAAGGDLSLADLVRVLRGGRIGHALGIALVCTKNEHLAPALRNDSRSNSAGTAETNPAFGNIDAVPESAWCVFPRLSRASEFMSRATEPIAYETYEAIREHGLFICDTSVETAALYINDPRSLGTPYCDTNINPFAGWEGTTPAATGVNEHVNNFVPESWTDPTLPHVKENLLGNSTLFKKLPWRTLEQLAPRGH